jgi:hypothetical protein
MSERTCLNSRGNCGAPLVTLALFLLFLVCSTAAIAARSHLIAFGPWLKVQLFVGADADRVQEMRIRSLNIDGHSREFTVGVPHDVTDRVFVVRRAFRMNDALTTHPEWKWQRDGWMMVDRTSGRISKLNLPDFDSFYSTVSWFRDYAAYCGVTDGQKVYAVVAQLGERKPVLRTYVGLAKGNDEPDSECAAPIWQKQPVRVTFEPTGGQKLSYLIHGRSSEPELGDERAEQREGEKQ